jgi:hypothetical protein
MSTKRIVAFHPALPAGCDPLVGVRPELIYGDEKEYHAPNLDLDHAKERKP